MPVCSLSWRTYILPYTVLPESYSYTPDKLHQPPIPPPPTPEGRGQPHTLPRYLILMINTYMYVCICICMYSTYILCTCYLYFYMNYIFTTLHCLYTTYTTRLQIDRHYLCTTYILPHIYIHIYIYNTYVPLVWMHQLLLYISPYSICSPLPTPTTPTERLGGQTPCDTMIMGGRGGTQNLEHIYICTHEGFLK